MSDANDTDAREASAEELLLVDLLYGELEGDAETQARARVEGDESLARELETYGELRAMLRALPEEEPPQAVSARLLHAAAEAAPKKRAVAVELAGEPGWWARLLQLFRPLVANPAVAAAAMLVLVAGVAGALYLGGNVEVSQPRSESAAEPPRSAVASPQSPALLAEPSRQAPGGDSLEGRGATLADEKADLGIAEDQPAAEPAIETERAREESRRPAESSVAKPSKKSLDFDAVDSKPKADPAKPTVKAPPPGGTSTRSTSSAGGSVSGKAGSGGLIDADDESSGAAVAPDAPAEPEPAPPPPPRNQTVQQKESDKSSGESASELHQRAVRAAADGECDAVRALATKIRGADAGYYDKLVRGDKRLAGCLNAPSKTTK